MILCACLTRSLRNMTALLGCPHSTFSRQLRWAHLLIRALIRNVIPCLLSSFLYGFSLMPSIRVKYSTESPVSAGGRGESEWKCY